MSEKFFFASAGGTSRYCAYHVNEIFEGACV